MAKRISSGQIGKAVGWIIVLAALILALWFVFFVLKLGRSIIYTPPEYTTNVYFYPEYVGINPNALAGCSKTNDNTYQCPQNVELEFYVGIRNSGNLALPVYARPRIGYECSSSGKCKNEAKLDGQSRCVLISNKIIDCYVGYTFNFTEKATYTIYPGAKSLATDYTQITGEKGVFNDIDVINMNNILIIKTD